MSEEISKTKLKNLFRNYGLLTGGKDEGVWQEIEVKNWTGEKALKMVKRIQEMKNELITIKGRETEGKRLDKINRVEVIDWTKDFNHGGGRQFVKWEKEGTIKIRESIQDDGRTLKIFIESTKGDGDGWNQTNPCN